MRNSNGNSHMGIAYELSYRSKPYDIFYWHGPYGVSHMAFAIWLFPYGSGQ